MKCSDYQKLISDRLDGNLPEGLAEKLEEHLRACDVCRQYQEELSAIDREVRAIAVLEAQDFPDFEVALRQRLTQAETRDRIPKPKVRLFRLVPAWAVGLFLMAAGIYLFFSLRPAAYQTLDLALLMSYEDSFLTITEALSSDENLKEKYNLEILNSIYEEVGTEYLDDFGKVENYIEQDIDYYKSESYLMEYIKQPEGK